MRKLKKKNAPKIVMDKIDMSAEREGQSISYFRYNNIGPNVLGRRISKENHKKSGVSNSLAPLYIH